MLLLLTSCSSTTIADLQQRPAREVYSTGKSPSQLAICLVENLGRLGAPSVYAREDGATIVNFTIENDTTATFTIRGGQVEVRTISSIIPFREKTRACL